MLSGGDTTLLFDCLPLPAFVYQLDDAGQPLVIHATPSLKQLQAEHGEAAVAALAATDDNDAVLLACQQAIRHPGQPCFFHLRVRGDEDTARPFAGQAVGVERDGELFGIGVLFDISHDDALYRQIAKETQDAALQTLVAGLVHDFRNTLTHIIGTTELLLFSCEGSDICDDLNLMLKSGERGSDMLTRLQQMIRLPSPPTASLAAEQALATSLSAVLDLARTTLPARISLRSQLETPLPECAIAPPQVRQILLALVANAAEAISATGQITVDIGPTTAHRFKVQSPALSIRVSDDGIGIAREHLDEVTRPFWTTHNDEGKLGLGLAIVSRLVRLHGGTLDIQSRPNLGTTVTVLLPSMAAAAEAAPASASGEQMAQPLPGVEPQQEPEPAHAKTAMQPWNILLVDDSPDVLHVHQGMLERMGHRVTTALNGYEALSIYNEHHAQTDLLVTDFRMPGMDGVDLSIEARRIDERLPILMITAYGDASKLQQVHEMDIELLDKPVSYTRLEQKLLQLQQARNGSEPPPPASGPEQRPDH